MTQNIKEQLSQLKVGDFVSKELHGAGEVSDGGTSEVFHIDQKARIFWIEEWDEKYHKDSVYAYSLDTGRSVNNFIAGFYQQVTGIA